MISSAWVLMMRCFLYRSIAMRRYSRSRITDVRLGQLGGNVLGLRGRNVCLGAHHCQERKSEIWWRGIKILLTTPTCKVLAANHLLFSANTRESITIGPNRGVEVYRTICYLTSPHTGMWPWIHFSAEMFCGNRPWQLPFTVSTLSTLT